MTTSRTTDLLTILQRHFNPREEGWLWVALYDSGREGGAVNQIEGAYDEPTATAHALADIINGVRPDHAYLALCRSAGRPSEVDRELWRELCRLVPAERLIDLAVFNQRQAWSMRAEDIAA